MGVRGELFSAKVALKNRTYFFNVKENRLGDLFMTVVESKPSEGEGFDRHQIVLFAEDLREFLSGFDQSLRFMEKENGTRAKAKRESRPRPAERDGSRAAPRSGAPGAKGKKVVRIKDSGGAKGREAYAQRAPGARKGPDKRPKVRSVKPKQD
jgi:hypothetical protein